MGNLTEVGKNLLAEALVLMNQLPENKQYYLLGYMQAEADRNLQGKANDQRGHSPRSDRCLVRPVPTKNHKTRDWRRK